MTTLCAIPLKTLLELDVTRRPVTARKLGFTRLIEQPKKALNYEDTECAKMEAARQPRRAARMKKLKNLNIDTK